jgi:fused signal recognition particle receptor
MSEIETQNKGWLTRLRDGLSRSTQKVSDSITGIFTKKKLDAETLGQLEDALIASDLGVKVSADICARISKDRYDKEISETEVRDILAQHITDILAPLMKPLDVRAFPRPHVILVVGVNGTGKTTTIAKLGRWFQEQDYSVMFAAGDTFRAAAIEQLQVWGTRLNIPVITTKVGGDAAGLAFDAITQARAKGADVVLIDTAGRLQNKSDLMAELSKVRRVLQKVDDRYPHDTILVLDATTGQNALNQIEVFTEIAGVTGLVMTKLDGTARGGILVAAADTYKMPIHALGIGEKMDDLRPFEAASFARALSGVADIDLVKETL